MCSGPWRKRLWQFRLPGPSGALLLTACLSLLSCASQSHKPGTFPLEKIEEGAAKRTAISGMVKFTHTAGGKSITAPGVMLAEWPDRFRLEVQDPVGSLLALLVIRGDRFWLFEKARKENLTGPLSALPGGMFRDFGTADLLRVVLARPALEIFQKAEVKENTAVAETSRGRQTLRWEGPRALVESWAIEPKGELRRAVEYGEYEARAGALFPTELRLVTGAPEKMLRSLLIVWSEWEPTVPKNEKLFQIPQEQSFGRPTKALP